jgi:predicted PurR-regulated permease PerM
MMGRAATFMEILFFPLILFFGGLFALANPNDRLLTPMMRVLPDGVRLAWYRIFQLLGDRLLGWAKGTATAMVAVAVLSITALLVIGVPNAVALGLFNGLVEFIPLFGPWIGGLTAVVVAFLDDPQKALWVAIAALAIQQIEANLITPWSMSRNAEVHPFVTLFALVLFGTLFGYLGILLALPLVILVWTIVQVLWVERAIDTDRERIAPVVSE